MRQSYLKNAALMTGADVVRHVLVQRIIAAYESYENKKNGPTGQKPAGRKR